MPRFSFFRTPSVVSWHSRLNYMTSIMCTLNVIAFALVSLNKEYPDIRLVYSRNHSVVHTGAKRFNVFAAFAMANTIVIVGNMWTAFRSGNTLKQIYTNGTFGRWGVMMITLPVLHTACLLGIARVYDAWAVMSCVTMVILSLLVMWTTGSAKRSDEGFLEIARPAILFGIYCTFWGFVWFTGDAHVLSILCLLIIVASIGLFRLFFKGEKDRAPLYREAITVMGMGIMHAGPPWIWVVSDSMSEKYSPMMMWSTFFSVVLIGISIFAWAILNVTNLDVSGSAPTDDAVDIGTTLLLQDGDAASVGIDSGSDDAEQENVLVDTPN